MTSFTCTWNTIGQLTWEAVWFDSNTALNGNIESKIDFKNKKIFLTVVKDR